MYVVLPISYLLTLALALPTGALLIRVFIVQHDCGHGSFFASRRANALAGRLCSLCTLTPYANWSRQHSVHHADWNNLHRRVAVPTCIPRASQCGIILRCRAEVAFFTACPGIL